MLRKVLIGLAVLIVLGGAAAGFEAYRLYNSAQGIFGLKHPTAPTCSSQTVNSTLASYPKLLPWTSASSPTSASTTTIPRTSHKKLKVCLVGGNQDPPLNGKKRINILLLGTDTDCKFKNSPILTQTIFVVTIDPVHKKVGMLSIPRDSFLPIPGYSTLGDLYTYHKIDEAFALGESAAGSSNPSAEFASGEKYAQSTVEQNFGIKINYFAWVGLTGFVKVINTLHGVDINALHPIVDDAYPGDLTNAGCYGFSRVYIPSGPQWMDGYTALQYVRSRHADLNGDFGRGARQLQTIVALRPKIEALGLTDFMTLDSLFNELNGYVKSDIGVNSVGGFVSFAKSLNPLSIHKLVLTPPYYSSGSVQATPAGNEDVVNLNWSTVQPAVSKMFAPISTGHHRHGPPHRLTFVSPAQAVAYLTRVSGATVRPASHSTATYSGPLNGSIYFDAQGNVWRYSSSGTQQVTHSSAIGSATITSNGHKLVYYRRWSQDNADVWVKNLQTGADRQITFGHNGDGNLATAQDCGGQNYPQCAWVWNVNPVVSPNGRTIVFSSDAYKDVPSPTLTVNSDCATAPYNGGIDLALYSYDVVSRTANQATAPCNGAGGDADARFDPANPNQIVYSEFYYLPNSSIASRLVVLNLTTGFRHRITPYRGDAMQAVWSQNGERMAWLGSSTQSTTLYVGKYSAGRLLKSSRRTVDTGMISQPEFSPDGKHLVYYKLVGSSFQVWIVNLRNGWPVGQPMRLFSGPQFTASAPLVWIK